MFHLHGDLNDAASECSVETGIVDMFRAGIPDLALTSIVFSVLFPLGKIAALSLVCFKEDKAVVGESTLTWLRSLSKWSILDVFVVGPSWGRLNSEFSQTPRHGTASMYSGDPSSSPWSDTYLITYLFGDRWLSYLYPFFYLTPLP